MEEKTNIPKSLTEQILDEMFASIEVRKEFDAHTIQKLKELIESGDSKKVPEITTTLKSAEGGTQ
jgi:hypothetical protein